jgi:hypothetical protein
MPVVWVMIGGGYGEEGWLAEQFDAAGSERVGCGLITWSLAEKSHLLNQVLECNPSALFLSFGDPAPFVAITKAANVPVICQRPSLARSSAWLIPSSPPACCCMTLSRAPKNYCKQISHRRSHSGPGVRLPREPHLLLRVINFPDLRRVRPQGVYQIGEL